MSRNLLAQRPLALPLPMHRLQPCTKLRCAPLALTGYPGEAAKNHWHARRCRADQGGTTAQLPPAHPMKHQARQFELALAEPPGSQALEVDGAGRQGGAPA